MTVEQRQLELVAAHGSNPGDLAAGFRAAKLAVRVAHTADASIGAVSESSCLSDRHSLRVDLKEVSVRRNGKFVEIEEIGLFYN